MPFRRIGVPQRVSFRSSERRMTLAGAAVLSLVDAAGSPAEAGAASKPAATTPTIPEQTVLSIDNNLGRVSPDRSAFRRTLGGRSTQAAKSGTGCDRQFRRVANYRGDSAFLGKIGGRAPIR